MNNNLNINQSLRALRQTNQFPVKKQLQNTEKSSSFKDLLSEKLQEKTGVKFSKHAQQRLLSREINVCSKDLQQLKKGVEKADSKGSKNSLVMVNNIGFVVSVENKTVITAIDKKNMQEKVFTNIDSSVFM
ncbi:MAG: TIGR02530 family flagellar biosynthesis protein [bacterium]